jgi:flagellin
MRINNNISASITNMQLLRTEDNLSSVMERLSSGLKINHAADDPSGIAISGKMHTQIQALNRASQNSSDGVNVIQTADGALSEVTNMLQRMRELAVQAANGLNSEEEKNAAEQEINSLRSEIDRISKDTEFNTKALLDGSLDTRVYGEHFSRIRVSDSVTPGTYKVTINAASKNPSIPQDGENQATVLLNAAAVTDAQAGIVKINDISVNITSGMSGKDVYEALRKGAEEANASVSELEDKDGNGLPLKITSDFYGKDSSLSVTVSNDALRTYLGFQDSTKPAGVDKDAAPVYGKDAELSLTYEQSTGTSVVVGFSRSATVSQNGNRYSITDKDGFEMNFLVEADYTGDLNLEVTDMGPMVLQIGANKDQNMKVRIPSVSAENLYLDEIDVTKSGGADRAIKILDEAISRVSSIRSDMGAAQNRLESTVDSLNETNENMNSAVSRIEDSDMASEMTDYTKYNVLQQAATSVLSQANEIPEMALQLLQH